MIIAPEGRHNGLYRFDLLLVLPDLNYGQNITQRIDIQAISRRSTIILTSRSQINNTNAPLFPLIACGAGSYK
jgi:hypothetical protein